MKLSALVKALPEKNIIIPNEYDPEITSIHYSTRRLKPGGIFVAIPGMQADGHDFIPIALEMGAEAIVAQRPVDMKKPLVLVENSRKAMALICDRFYDSPSKKLKLIAITGTNGKTTTAFLLESILLQAGIEPGVIGTINYRYKGSAFENPMTTPESADLQRILARMADEGVTHVVLEASSHAIDLHRIYGCRVDVGIFTNLSQDHLDYHKTMESYWDCKQELFTVIMGIENSKNHLSAVINCDDEKGKELFSLLRARDDLPIPISTGTSKDNKVMALSPEFTINGITGKISCSAGSFEFKSSLVGHYNLENILSAIGAASALRLPLDSMQKGINRFTSVPGRMERIENKKSRSVFVDYAHTPDALDNVLSMLSELAEGRIICVFGCGGDRDRSKRLEMGKITATLSDFCIVTSDNPRTEDPTEIISDIMKGITPLGLKAYDRETLKKGIQEKGYFLEPDRRMAIKTAFLVSEPEDTVLIAGKGHETYQIIGNKKFPFDDRREARSALEGLYE